MCHSLIISRAGLLLSLSILPCPQGSEACVTVFERRSHLGPLAEGRPGPSKRKLLNLLMRYGIAHHDKRFSNFSFYRDFWLRARATRLIGHWPLASPTLIMRHVFKRFSNFPLFWNFWLRARAKRKSSKKRKITKSFVQRAVAFCTSIDPPDERHVQRYQYRTYSLQTKEKDTHYVL